MRVAIANAEVQGEKATIPQIIAKIQIQKAAIAQGQVKACSS